MQNNSASAVECAGDIWAHPELGELETYSSGRLAGLLEGQGFEITRDVAGLPTAWVASFSNGPGPVIGYLAEFDALPGLSQAAGGTERKPLVAGGTGHGCGHNLLGTASAFAALGVRQAMIQHKLPGTVKVFGCPAEETLVGKVYMTREGVFDGVVAMLGWHPGGNNAVTYKSSLAMTSLKFRFHGRTAHGAGDPHHGRSALDAVELMSAGVNYMREHVIDKARIHYVITNGGGAPNVVPDIAEVWYYVRAPKTEDQRPILEWVRQIAEGAAMMTRTRLEEELLTSGYEVLLNDPLAELLQENLEEVGPPLFDESDWEFARGLSRSFDEPDSVLLDTTVAELEIVPPDEWGWGGGSTDDGDVSWNVPYGRITTACFVKGSPGHSWQVVSCSGSQTGFKGMLTGARVLAGAGVDLLQQPKWIERAREDFVKKLAGRTYQCGVPDSLPPPHSR
ncbi:MAG: amidohydrolase [Candidatus Glassbacteria bacterium]|nr:amidohydrolase [Candidatus Glassbacteria bacterium]